MSLSLLILFHILNAEAVELPKLKLQWEAVEDAKFYEIELRPTDRPNQLKRFKVDTTRFDQPMEAGKYRFRLRSYDVRGSYGPWSESIPIVVKNPEKIQLSPGEGEVVKTGGLKKRKIRFRWKAIEGAERYIIILKQKRKQKAFRTQKEQTEITLTAGKKYSWRVDVVDANGVEYKASNPIEFFVELGELDTPQITPPPQQQVRALTWTEVRGAEWFEVELYFQPLLSEKWTKQRAVKLEVSEWSFERALSPGRYKVKLKAASPNIQSAAAELTFLVKPLLAELQENITGIQSPVTRQP